MLKNWFTRKILMNIETRLILYNAMELELACGKSLPIAVQAASDDLTGMWAAKRKEIFAKIHAPLDDGQPFGHALRGFFPSDEILLASTVWNGSDPAKGVASIIDRVEAKAEQGSDALFKFTPGIMVYWMALVIYFIEGSKLKHQWAVMSAGSTPDGWITAVINYASLGLFFPLLLASLPIWVVIILQWSYENWRGSLRAKFDDVGPWYLYRKTIGSDLLLTIGTMGENGISPLRCVDTLSSEAGNYAKEALLNAKKGIEAGRKLGSCLKRGETIFLPEESICKKVARMENADDFGARLVKLSNRYSKQLGRTINKKTSFWAFTWLVVAMLCVLTFQLFLFHVTDLAEVSKSMRVF